VTPWTVRQRGFTLLEVVVSAAILAMVVTAAYTLMNNTIRGQDQVREGLRAPKVQNAILGQIIRDFRYAYWPDFTGAGGFLGQNRSVAGRDGDRVDFVTTRRTRLARAEDTGARDPGSSPVNEVGYACRPNDRHPEWIALYRREDFFVDDAPTEGGQYSLIYDRLRSFNLIYYPNPREVAKDQKGLEEWDSRIRKSLPYAIIVEIKFDTVDDPRADPDLEPQSITRIILLRGGAEDVSAPVTEAAMPPAM
jgi:prepilin-type N-terminal cleavage/methylation domain-containing protein